MKILPRRRHPALPAIALLVLVLIAGFVLFATAPVQVAIG